ncbi:TIGR03826 family flagellar region protein [Cytobacillus sp. Hm23]
MAELDNCPKCDNIFVKNQFRDVCDNCYKEEEKAYQEVYNYIRKRENRTATMDQVVVATGVEEELIIKFIKKGRLKLAQFPNLGYQCERCGTTIRDGKICPNCVRELQSELYTHNKEETRKQELKEKEKETITYFSVNKNRNK